MDVYGNLAQERGYLCRVAFEESPEPFEVIERGVVGVTYFFKDKPNGLLAHFMEHVFIPSMLGFSWSLISSCTLKGSDLIFRL